jgi:hypothetical protein
MAQNDVSVRCTPLTGSWSFHVSTTVSWKRIRLVLRKVAWVQCTTAMVLHVLEMVYSSDGGIVGEVGLDSCVLDVRLVVS